MNRKELILYLKQEWDVPQPLPGLSRKSLKELQDLVGKLRHLRTIQQDAKKREHEKAIYDWFVNKRKS
tara:strand:- start:359 stop:562 length:204 start_codon:yes stop_codon:yes gene_type:complete